MDEIAVKARLQKLSLAELDNPGSLLKLWVDKAKEIGIFDEIYLEKGGVIEDPQKPVLDEATTTEAQHLELSRKEEQTGVGLVSIASLIYLLHPSSWEHNEQAFIDLGAESILEALLDEKVIEALENAAIKIQFSSTKDVERLDEILESGILKLG